MCETVGPVTVTHVRKRPSWMHTRALPPHPDRIHLCVPGRRTTSSHAPLLTPSPPPTHIPAEPGGDL